MFRHELEPSLGPEHNLYLICNRKIILFQRVFVTRFDEYERSLILNPLLIERILILFHFLTRGLEFNFADEFSLLSQAHTLLTQQFRLGLKWFLIIASQFCHSFSLPLFSFVCCVLCRRVIFYVSVICLTNIENHFSFSNAAAAVLRKKMCYAMKSHRRRFNDVRYATTAAAAEQNGTKRSHSILQEMTCTQMVLCFIVISFISTRH